jgi:hypothetical protein
MTPEEKYPALMAYIRDRSSDDERTEWNMLRADEAAAIEGSYLEVAQDLEHAQADYATAQIVKGESGYAPPRPLLALRPQRVSGSRFNCCF